MQAGLDFSIGLGYNWRMPILKMPSFLRSYVGGLAELPVSGRTVGEGLADLFVQFPALQPHLVTDAGKLRPFVNLYVNGMNIKELNELATPLDEQAVLLLVPSVAGG